MTKVFRGLIVVSTVIYIVYYFLPYIDWRWLSSDALDLLSLSGYEAKFTLPLAVEYAIFGAWVLSAVGMYFFIPAARSAFVWLYILTTISEPFRGIFVQTGLSATLQSTSTLLDGAIIAIAYLTSVERVFVVGGTDASAKSVS